MRIGGLASGMDIDSIVANLMKAERMPLDKLKQQKQTLEWQRDDYRSMNTLLLDFRSELTQMKLSSKYRARTVSSSDDARVSATATSSASQGSYSISEVKSLASSASRISSELSGATKIDASKSLESQKSLFAGALTWSEGAVASKTLKGNGSTTGLSLDLSAADGQKVKTAELSKMSVKINGVAYEVVSGTLDNTKNQVTIDESGNLTFSKDVASGANIKVDYITDKHVQTGTVAKDATTFQLQKKNILPADFKLTVGTTDYTIASHDSATNIAQLSGGLGEVDLTTGKVTFTSPLADETEVKAVYKQNYADFSITSETSKGAVTEKFLIQSSDTLNQFINTVNGSNAGVSMIYDSYSDKISLTRKETGNYSADGAKEMNISGSFDSVLNLNAAAETDGTDAVFVINGLETRRSSNTFNMNGVNFTLKQTFAAGDTPVSMSINSDGNQVYDNIKSFVDKYNELIGKMNSKMSESKYRSYLPLTDEQRESLSDKQQEQWEEKAKSGLLRRDPILSSALSAMRSDFYQPVTNSETDPMFKQLASIGITTSANYLEGGKLQISESKLKEAINNNPEAVEALFKGGGDSALESEQGIIHRLYNSVNESMDKLKAKAGNSFSTNQQFAIGRNLLGIDSRIDRFEDRLKTVEDRYWKQFTAMEKAIQRSNQQSTYLMNQFSNF